MSGLLALLTPQGGSWVGVGGGGAETLELRVPLLGVGKAAEKGRTPSAELSARLSSGQAPCCCPQAARNGSHGTVPRLCPGCTVEGDTTRENTQGSAHASGSCSDTLNFLAPSQVHTQPIQSCCQTVCPNSWFSKQSRDTLCLPGLNNWQTFPSAGLQTLPGFWFPLKGLTSTSPSCGMVVGSWWHLNAGHGGP